MDDSELKTMLDYLRSKGLVDTAHALLAEQVRASTKFHPGVPRNRPVDDPSGLYDGYSMLRAWVYRSMEPYKHELLGVLYPAFVQSFANLVKGGNAVEALSLLDSFSKDHLEAHSVDVYEMERTLSMHSEGLDLPQFLRDFEFRVVLCKYSYELLLNYLQKTKALVMLEIINDGIIFEVSAEQPSVTSSGAQAAAETAAQVGSVSAEQPSVTSSGAQAAAETAAQDSDPLPSLREFVEEILYPAAQDSNPPLLPLSKEVVAEIIKNGSVSALIATSVLKIFGTKTSQCHGTIALLAGLPQSLLPLDLLTIALGMGAVKDNRLVGMAANCFIAQLMYIFYGGVIRALACTDKKDLLGVSQLIFWFFFYTFSTLFIWGILSEQPKVLHLQAKDIAMVGKKFDRAIRPRIIVICLKFASAVRRFAHGKSKNR